MLFTAQDIWDSLYRQHNVGDDADKISDVKREVRKAYYELCRRTDWELLRDEVEYALRVNARRTGDLTPPLWYLLADLPTDTEAFLHVHGDACAHAQVGGDAVHQWDSLVGEIEDVTLDFSVSHRAAP